MVIIVVIIMVIIRNDDHWSSYGHYFKMMSMVIIWWPWQSWPLVWSSFSKWRPWSLFSWSLYARRTTMHKKRMMTMVVIFRMTTMAAIPERSWKNRRRPWNDDHKEWWPWMMTVAKKCQPDQFVDKNRKWKQKPTIRKFEQTFDHYIAFLILQCTGKGDSAPVCRNTLKDIGKHPFFHIQI